MPTYNGSLAMRLAGTEELLVRTAAFRGKVGAANIDAAREKVYVGELLDVLAMGEQGTLEVARPCAIIGIMSHSYSQIGQGAQIDLGANGAVWVLFADNPDCPEQHKQSCLNFVDWTSAVMDEVAGLVGRSVDDGTGQLGLALWPFNSISMFFEPTRPDFADRRTGDDYWLGGYVLHDAINGGGQ
jgi:hypothetical protein